MASRVISITSLRRSQRARAAGRSRSVRIAVFLLVPVSLLVVVGLGALLSASSVPSIQETGDSLFFFKRQLAWASIGIVAMVATAAVPYRIYLRLAAPILIATAVLLVLTWRFGVAAGGSRRWLVLGPVTIQAAELAKFAAVVFLASVLARREVVLHRFREFAGPVAVALGLLGFLLMLQPDLGTTLIMGAGAVAVMMASSAPLSYVLTVAGAGGMAGLALAASASYRWDRVTAFLDPFRDELDTGFQAVQSLVALGTGGMLGVGLGLSRARWSFLPNAHTDFIFAIIGEETGFAGAIAVVLLYLIFTVAGLVVAMRAPDRFGRLLAVGIVAWLSIQAIVNIGGTTALLPITGVPLPFMSFGGSALLTDLAAVGILVNIARAGAHRR